jgi:hypothetical protein
MTWARRLLLPETTQGGEYMRLVQVTKDVSNHLNEMSERYQVPERLRSAGEQARRGANAAYRTALDHPRESMIAGAILAAAVIGGVLWYVFRDRRRPQARTRPTARVRAGAERRKRSKAQRAAAA